MKITRKYVFQNGKKANANEVNAEFDQILDYLNGKIENDNIKDSSIAVEKLSFRLASKKFLGMAASYNELPTRFSDAIHGDVAITDSLEMYMYDENTMSWKKISGAVATTTHNQLNGRDLYDSHPQSAITGLEDRLTGIDTSLTNLASKDTTHDTKIASNTSNIQSLQTDTGTLRTDVNKNAADIVANKSDADTKIANVNTALTNKADKSTTYTKTEVDTALGTKVDKQAYNTWSHGYVRRTGSYAVAANATIVVPFNNVVTDQAAEFDAGTNNNFIQVKTDGVYVFSPHVVLTGLPSSTDVYIYLMVYVDRGTGYVSERVIGHENYRTSPGGPQIAGTTQVSLKAGDKVRFGLSPGAACSVAEHNGTFVTWAKVSN